MTVRVVRDVGRLRTRKLYRAIQWATLAAARRARIRIIHLSIQHNHLHLLVEARDERALARGMQGFQISAAKHINAALIATDGTRRRGRVFADRYHAHILRSPRETRAALAYVLNNWRRHGEDRGRPWRVDPFSSGIRFAGWLELAASPLLYAPPPTYDPLFVWLPRTWLLRTGWTRHGPVSVFEAPGPRAARHG